MKNTGYIHVDPVLGNYVHGDEKLGDLPTNPSGQWDLYLPETNEQDGNGFEPFDCVTEATVNCVETLEIQEYSANSGWARRYLAKNSGTDLRGGNDPQTVCEILRTKGCTLATDYPFQVSDFVTFYQALTQALKTLAIASFSKYSYGHAWVNADPESMIDALTYSPLSAAGYAWSEPDPTTGYYVTPPNTTPEHDFMIYGYVENNYWKVRDSYAPFEKKLAWDFTFTGIKRHTLNRQISSTPVAQNAWQNFLQLIRNIVASWGSSTGS